MPTQFMDTPNSYGILVRDAKVHRGRTPKLMICLGLGCCYAADCDELRLGFFCESLFQNGGQPLLTLGDPSGIVAPNHLLTVAKEFSDIAHCDSRSLKQYARKRVPKAVRRGFLGPGAAQIPEALQFPAPDIRDHVHVLRLVLAKNEAAVFLSALANPLLEPFRDPGIDLSAVFRRPDMTLAICQQATNMEGAHIRYSKTRVEGYRDEIGEILAVPSVSIIGRVIGTSRFMVHLPGPDDRTLAVLSLTGLEHPPQLVIAEG